MNEYLYELFYSNGNLVGYTITKLPNLYPTITSGNTSTWDTTSTSHLLDAHSICTVEAYIRANHG